MSPTVPFPGCSLCWKSANVKCLVIFFPTVLKTDLDGVWRNLLSMPGQGLELIGNFRLSFPTNFVCADTNYGNTVFEVMVLQTANPVEDPFYVKE